MDGIPDTGSKKIATEKGVPERKGELERKDESEDELEIEEKRVDRTDPSLRPDHRYYAVRSMLAKGQQPKLGSVILIHANLNEQLGVKLMLDWVGKQKPGSITFLPLSDIAKNK